MHPTKRIFTCSVSQIRIQSILRKQLLRLGDARRWKETCRSPAKAQREKRRSLPDNDSFLARQNAQTKSACGHDSAFLRLSARLEGTHFGALSSRANSPEVVKECPTRNCSKKSTPP